MITSLDHLEYYVKESHLKHRLSFVNLQNLESLFETSTDRIEDIFFDSFTSVRFDDDEVKKS